MGDGAGRQNRDRRFETTTATPAENSTMEKPANLDSGLHLFIGSGNQRIQRPKKRVLTSRRKRS